MECESKSDTDNNRKDLNSLKITQTIPHQHNAKSRNPEFTETSHIGNCTQTVERANVKVKNTFHGRNNVTCNRNYKYRTVVTLNTLETRFVSGT